MYVIKLKDESNGILCLHNPINGYRVEILPIDQVRTYNKKNAASTSLTNIFEYYAIKRDEERKINGYKKSDFEIRKVKLTLI